METLCHVCFNELGNEFEVINDVTKCILDVLLLKMNLDISENFVICHSCVELAKKSFEFKSMFLDTEKIILSFAIEKEGVKFDINDIFEDSKGTKIINRDPGVCRFCMNQWERRNLVSMDSIMTDVIFVDLLAIFVPEMDFDVIKGAMICPICKMSLESYIMFLNTFLDKKEKINKMFHYKRIDDTCWSRTSNMPQSFMFTLAKVSEINRDINKLKEALSCGVSESIKTEQMDIKVEEVFLRTLMKLHQK